MLVKSVTVNFQTLLNYAATTYSTYKTEQAKHAFMNNTIFTSLTH